MSVFEKLQNYNSRGKTLNSSVFDTSKPDGAFLTKIHNEGFKMYDIVYRNNDTEIAEEEYNNLSDIDKNNYTKDVKFTELHDAITSDTDILVNAIAGSGKALKNGTKVLSSNGFVPIESLKVGDDVYSDDGKLYKIDGVFPQGKKQIYNVYTSSGDVIPCSPDHLWTVKKLGSDAWETIDTNEMFNQGCMYKLPSVIPIDFNKHLIYNAYALGLHINKFLNFKKSNMSYIVLGDWFVNNPSDGCFNNLPNDLSGTDLLVSLQERQDLLRGILNISNEGFKSKYVLSSKNTDLLKDIKFLCDSLSVATTLESEVLCIYLSKEFINSLGTAGISCNSMNAIVKVEPTKGYHDMTCISITSPSHLYLTEHFIPTHNTTFLIFKIMYDIVTGRAMTLRTIPTGQKVPMVNKMWVCTFLKSGAEELEKSLSKWQRALGYTQTSNQVVFSTLDAEFQRCLKSMGVNVTIGDSSKIHSLFCRAVDSCNITRDGKALTKEDYQILSSIITYSRGRLDDKRYTHPSCSDYGLTPTIINLIINQFAKLRQVSGVMDFDEIMELLYQYLYITPNPAIQDFVANRYNFIYIDEFQDTSQIQYAILKFYARGRLWLNRFGGDVKVKSEGGCIPDGLYTASESCGKITIIGDPSQTIYSFKGSDSNIITDKVVEDFNPNILSLSTNWRCPANILNPVVSSIHLNDSSKNQNIIAHAGGGDFKALKFANLRNMLDRLKADLIEDMNEDLSVAILVRTNFDGMIPALFLESCDRFNFSISGDNMTLSSPLPRKLIGVASLFTERSTPTVKNALSLFTSYGEGYAVKEIVDICKANNINIWQIPNEDLKYSAPNLAKTIASFKSMFFIDGKRNKTLEVQTLRAMYYWLLVNTFKGDSAYAQSARNYIETLIYILDSYIFNSVYDFIEKIEELNDGLSTRIKKKNTNIRIATVHEFKGKEADSVYIWNDSDNVFPSSKCDLYDKDQLEEERRVHYIACTRARKKEHIYSITNKLGLFAKELDTDWITPDCPSASLGSKK